MWFPLIHRAVKVSTTIGVVLVAVLAFLAVRAEDTTMPLGSDSLIFVSETSLSDEEFARAVTAAAQAHDINFFKLTNRPDGSTTVRVLYLAAGDSAAISDLVAHGYPDFDPGVRTEIHPISELSEADPRGYYAVSAPEPALPGILADLRERSITATPEHARLGALGLVAEQFPLLPVLTSLFLTTILVTGYAHWAHTKRRAVLEVNGSPPARSLGSAVLQASSHLVSIGMASSVVAAVALHLYNGGNQTARFVGAFWMGLLALGACIVACQLAFGYFSPGPPLPSAIRGARNIRGLIGAATAVSLLALSAAASTAARVPEHVDEREALQASTDAWRGQPERTVLRFGGALTNEDFEYVTPGVADLYRGLEIEGLASITVPGWADGESTRDFNPEGGNTIIASPQYLSRVDVVGTDGQAIRPSSINEGAVTLLIPATAADRAAEIGSDFAEFFDFQESVDTDNATGRNGTAIDVRFTRAGQDVFNEQPGAGQAFQADPVIAIVSASSGALSDNYYMAAASSQHATFNPAVNVPLLLKERDLERYIPSSYELRRHVLAQLADRSLTLTLAQAGAALQVLAAVSSAVTLAITLAYSQRRRSFLMRINGSAWFPRNVGFLVGMLALVAVVAAFVVTAEGLTPVRTAWVGAALVLISAITVVTYAISERRFTIREARE